MRWGRLPGPGSSGRNGCKFSTHQYESITANNAIKCWAIVSQVSFGKTIVTPTHGRDGAKSSQVHRKGHQLPDFSVRRKKISRMNSRRLAERILFGLPGWAASRPIGLGAQHSHGIITDEEAFTSAARATATMTKNRALPLRLLACVPT